MAAHICYAYAPDALTYDSGTNTWTLRADYDPYVHRVRIEITDDDTFFDGDALDPEVGHDTNQTANVYDMDGNLLSSGLVYDEMYYNLDGGISIDQIEIGGVVVGYLPTAPLDPGVAYTQTGWNDVRDAYGNVWEYSQFPSVPCFGAGTSLAGAEGQVAVEWLKPGELILTRDHGFQPVLWVGRFEVAAEAMHADASLHPRVIEAGAFGVDQPRHDLTLSRQHRVLLCHPQLDLYFAEHEVFCAAGHLDDLDQVSAPDPDGPVVYYHVLFAEHEVVLADGLWTESMFAGSETLACLPADDRRAVRAALRPAGAHTQTARLCLKRREAALLMPILRKARERRAAA